MSEQENKPQVNPYMIFHSYEKPDGGLHAEVFLYHTVQHPFFYLDLLQFLYEAGEGDTCRITIDNNGGYLVTGVAISDAIKKTKAHVTTNCIGIAASAAAVIFTPGHTKEAFDWGYLMYHTASYGIMGNTKDHRDQLEYIEALIYEILVDGRNEKLIEDKDIEDMLKKAKDLFISGEEIKKRLSVGE